ncbi:MAG: hypothetical protein A4E72_00882 [Syntrophus sp. PtaU1.Bin208]|nr:MAG: hypothetical protein A4E72_00882 [Syntrophus sp. PtaU1.Bin208]
MNFVFFPSSIEHAITWKTITGRHVVQIPNLLLCRQTRGRGQEAGAGDKTSVMAQADIDIQALAPTKDPGRCCGRSPLLPGDLQILEVLGKQPGKVEPCCKPDSFGLGRRDVLKRGIKIMDMPGEIQRIRCFGEGQAVKVCMMIVYLNPALPAGCHNKTRTPTRKARPLNLGRVVRVTSAAPGIQ